MAKHDGLGMEGGIPEVTVSAQCRTLQHAVFAPGVPVGLVEIFMELTAV